MIKDVLCKVLAGAVGKEFNSIIPAEIAKEVRRSYSLNAKMIVFTVVHGVDCSGPNGEKFTTRLSFESELNGFQDGTGEIMVREHLVDNEKEFSYGISPVQSLELTRILNEMVRTSPKTNDFLALHYGDSENDGVWVFAEAAVEKVESRLYPDSSIAIRNGLSKHILFATPFFVEVIETNNRELKRAFREIKKEHSVDPIANIIVKSSKRSSEIFRFSGTETIHEGHATKCFREARRKSKFIKLGSFLTDTFGMVDIEVNPTNFFNNVAVDEIPLPETEILPNFHSVCSLSFLGRNWESEDPSAKIAVFNIVIMLSRDEFIYKIKKLFENTQFEEETNEWILRQMVVDVNGEA